MSTPRLLHPDVFCFLFCLWVQMVLHNMFVYSLPSSHFVIFLVAGKQFLGTLPPPSGLESVGWFALPGV